MQTETFWGLVRSAGHWEFELLLMILFDVILGGIFYPFIRKHWEHHVARDLAEEVKNVTFGHLPQPRPGYRYRNLPPDQKFFSPMYRSPADTPADKLFCLQREYPEYGDACLLEKGHPGYHDWEKKTLDRSGPRC